MLTDVRRWMFPFIDAALEHGCEQIVFLSLLGAEKNRIVPHRKVEDYLRQADAPYTFLRPAFYAKPEHHPPGGDRARRDLRAGRPRQDQLYIDATDVAAALSRR